MSKEKLILLKYWLDCFVPANKIPLAELGMGCAVAGIVISEMPLNHELFKMKPQEAVCIFNEKIDSRCAELTSLNLKGV